MRLLVTAGPTREPIDDVRYLSNSSSGKLGLALVEVARARGHDVVLVLGPADVSPPLGVEVRRVQTTLDLERTCLELFPACDAVIMAAAPADFRPRERVHGKIKKEGRASLVLELVANPDVVAELGARKRPDQVLVGFALEAAEGEEALANARGKIARKRLDAIVLNGPSNLGADRASAVILRGTTGEKVREVRDATKRELALAVLDEVEELTRGARSPAG